MNLRRFAYIIAILARHALGRTRDLFAARSKWSRRWIPVPISGPERVRRLFEDLGGTYLKFGQMLALQPDILPLEYCNALFDLLDRVTPFPFSEVERIFSEEFGKSIPELFDAFDPEPLASASIGQVHVAWRNGMKLAVKVQRPSVDRDFAGDIRLMNGAIWLIRTLRLRPFEWLIEPVSEFVGWTREELDYRYEARYLCQLMQNAADNPNERIPELFADFTSPRTLALEFLEGHTVLGYLRALERADTCIIDHLEAEGFDSHVVASRIVDNFLGDVFEHGLFHADLHPANLLILPGNRIGYVDFGIVGTISSYSRQNLVALTFAYARGDIDGMCEAFFRVSTIDARSSPARFREGLARESVTWYERDGGRLRLRKNFTRVMLDMSRLSLKCGVRPAREVVKYIRSSVAIDGLITRFAPTFDLGAHLETVCADHLKRGLRDSAFTFDNLLTSALRLAHLFQDGAPRAAAALDLFAAHALEPYGRFHAWPVYARAFRQRALYSAGFLFIVCLCAWVSPGQARFGVNLFTSEAALASAALLALVNNLRKLSKGE